MNDRHLLIESVTSLVSQWYASPLTLRSIASRLERQPTYLGMLFQKETGVSFHEFLTRIRLQHAVELIQAGTKIDAVSLCVGYRSKKNFYRQFKRYFGVTPRQMAAHQHACAADLQRLAPDMR